MIGETATRERHSGGVPFDDEPPAVFELLADESRFAILRELRRAGDAPVGYSDLRRRADIGDSGRFNYHLKRLTGTLVADVEGGYDLHAEAETLLDAVLGTPPDPADGRTPDRYAADGGRRPDGGVRYRD